jgi:hypothetical protein
MGRVGWVVRRVEVV